MPALPTLNKENVSEDKPFAIPERFSSVGHNQHSVAGSDSDSDNENNNPQTQEDEPSNQTKKVVIDASSAAIVACAIPVGAVATIQAIGFTSGGIASGSMAAGMMAAGAVEGFTAAGSTVATCQSIGAIGFGAVLPICGIVAIGIGVLPLVGLGVHSVVRSFTDTPPLFQGITETLPFKAIAIKAPNGRYITALGGGFGNWFFDTAKHQTYTGVLKAEAVRIQLWERFTVHDVGDGQFALQAHHKSFFSARDGGGDDITACEFHKKGWEKFKFDLIEKLDDNKWIGCFRTYDGSYVTINHTHNHFVANGGKCMEDAARFEVHGIA